eukprot:TRINITY_DN72152_c0_g1_i1.p1 TRINITY_DN72152_c0_g1~~TRINITY_DN72152_c0_g1_i1.p1  ORF type:complete len:437 (-),score=76.80 TRINITY_DN72152_c0_g1_i1:257-1567(-)
MLRCMVASVCRPVARQTARMLAPFAPHAYVASRHSLRFKAAEVRPIASKPWENEDDDDFSPPVAAKRSSPRRRWMSVGELVAEFERALARGERLGSDESTYQNLREEAKRLRLENDEIMATLDDLNKRRAELVAVEASSSLQLQSDGSFEEHGAEEVEVLKAIREIDYEAAALRYQQCVNIQDVGLLKRTMNRIESMSEVNNVVDRIDASLDNGEPLEANGPEIASIDRLVEKYRSDYDASTNAVWEYRDDMKEVIASLRRKGDILREYEGDYETQDVADVRWDLVSDLQQMKRMLAQLSRLRDMQKLTAKEIGLLERSRTKLIRHARVRALIKEGDRNKLEEKLKKLNTETSQLRNAITSLESAQNEHLNDSSEITEKLREMTDVWTPESGNLRQKLIASINTEEKMRARLAVLRGTQVENIRFISMINAALKKC